MEPRAWTKSSDTDKRKSALVSSSAWDGALRSSPTASKKPVIAARPAATEDLEGFEYLTSRFPHLAISFPGSRAHAVGLRPHSAQRLEQIGDRRPLRAQRVDAVLFGREQVALRIEHLELTGHAVLVAKARKPKRGPQRRYALALGLEPLPRLGLRHERVAHVAERVLDRKLVLGERLAFARAGGLHLCVDAPARVDRLARRERGLPDPGRPGKQVGQRYALAAQVAGEGERGKVSRPRYCDAGICRDERLLGLNQIRPAQQQIRGQACRDDDRNRPVFRVASRVERAFVDRSGALAEQHGKGVL